MHGMVTFLGLDIALNFTALPRAVCVLGQLLSLMSVYSPFLESTDNHVSGTRIKTTPFSLGHA